MNKNLFSLPISVLLILFLLLTACTPETVLTPEPMAAEMQPPTVTDAPVDAAEATDASADAVPATSAPEVAARSTETAITPGVQPEDLRGVRIQFWHTWTRDTEFAILSLVNEFNASNEHGIVVTAFSHGGDLYQDVKSGVNLGVLPNLAVGYNNQIQSWDNYGGIIVDMNEYMDDPDWGLDESEQADFFPAIWEQDVADGKRLGLPVYRAAMLLFYNQSWARALGFDSPPVTPDEFKEQACAAAAANNNGTGGWIASSDTSTTMSWILAFGGDGINEAGDGYQFDTPEVEAAFTFIKGLFNASCAWIPESYYPNEEFATRQGLFYTSSIAGLPYQVYAFEDANSADEWTVIPYPSPDGQPVIDVYGPAYTIIQSTPEEHLAAWLFIKWIAQPENQAAFIEASGYFPTRS
ncbi:MAG: extracellular solute-binding protein, partial [Chloroflexota bacterium]